MNNATVDCAHFVTAIDKVNAGEETMANAVSEYEKEVINRGTYEATLSRQLTLTIHQWDRFLGSPIMKYGGNLAREIETSNFEQKVEASAGVIIEGSAA